MPEKPFKNNLKSTALLAEEYAIAICINDINYAVMMVTPFDLEDYVIGFLFSEQVIKSNNDIHDIDIAIDHPNFTVQINATLANRCLHLISNKKRQLAGQSGCGICGVAALQQALPPFQALEKIATIAAEKLTHLREECQQWQTLANKSGALHAALLIDDSGKILHCREDIGRHNALDKLIGYMVSKNITSNNKGILITSRCSIEMVHKTINIGVSHLFSLASPSRLALNIAHKANVNLAHLSKNDGALFFSQPIASSSHYEK